MAFRATRQLAALLLLLAASPALVAAQALPALPQAEQEAEKEAPLNPATIQEQQYELRKRVGAIESRIRQERNETGVSTPHLERHLALLRQVDLVYEQQLAAIKRIAELKEDAARAKQEDISDLLIEREYALTAVDALRDELDNAEKQAELGTNALGHAERRLRLAKEALESKEGMRRKIKEALGRSSEEAEKSKRQIELRTVELESTLTKARVALRKLEVEQANISNEKTQYQLIALRKQVKIASQSIVFSQADLDAEITKLEAEHDKRAKELGEFKTALEKAESEFEKADAQFERSSTPTAELRAKRDAREAKREAAQLRLGIANRTLQQLEETKLAWKQRYQLFHGAQGKMLQDWKSAADANVAEITQQKELDEARLSATRREMSLLEQRISDLPSGSRELRRWLQAQDSELKTQEDVLTTSVSQNEWAISLFKRLRSELEERSGGKRGLMPLSVARDVTSGIWNYELTVVDDSAITTGKIISALILLIFGYWISRLLARQLDRRVLERLNLTKGVSHALKSLAFYTLLFLFTLFALKVVHIPLTLFTVVGGALAIGVGFGSRNIMNNFISGIILLIEQPIRVGDVIEFDDLRGMVKHIGARSTTVLAPTFVDIIVPNSTFLEKNVINWTLANNKVRLTVNVGVAYGSPTREVANLIKKAVTEHGRVLKDPGPIILFDEFGDNALNFKLHFWIRMKSITDCRIVESDIRYRIDSLFRSAGIVIAFPQRDVHFDTATPLQIEVTRGNRSVRDVDEEKPTVAETQMMPAFGKEKGKE